METSKTFKSIVRDKFLEHLEKKSWEDMKRIVFSAIVFVVLAISLVNIPQTVKLFKIGWFFMDFAIPKVCAAFLLVRFWSFWKKCALWVHKNMTESIERMVSPEPEDGAKTFFGIPTVELVEYIFEHGSFVRVHAETHFGLPRNKFDAMAKEMDRVKIFVRGENNSRVINPDMSRADVVSIFEKSSDVELRPLFRQVSECSFTSEPSMPSIIERASSPSLDTGFTIRPLNHEICMD